MRPIRILVGILLFCALIHNPISALSTPLTDTYSLTLAWNPSPSPGIIGCRLYYGTDSGEYTDVVVVENETTTTVSGLVPGVTYYFAITAVATNGQESDFSNEISYRQDSPPVALPGGQLQIQVASDGQATLTMAGPAGHTYEIEASEDFTTWTVIGTATVDETGSLNFTDIDAPNYPQRFYRTHDTQPDQQNLPPAQLQIRGVPDGQYMLTISGPPGRTYEIEATEDFTTWTVIGTATLDASGSLDFTDTDAPNHSQRFYRLRDGQVNQQVSHSPPAQMQLRGVSDGQFMLTVNGPAGHTYDIEASEDLTIWTVIGTATTDEGGSLDFTDTDAPNYPQRFYRTRDTQL
jgi:hypothetical protein